MPSFTAPGFCIFLCGDTHIAVRFKTQREREMKKKKRVKCL